MQVAKWGNSLAVRIPADVARALGLKEGDSVDFEHAEDGTVHLVTETERRRRALRTIEQMARRLPDDYKFDREEANAR